MRKLLASFNILLIIALCSLPQVDAAPEKDGGADEKKLQEELQAARAELSEAARKVAELSSQLSAGGEHFVFEFEEPRRSDRAMLGVTIASVADNEKDGGVRIISVTPGGPADKAGIQSGDVLLRIGDKELAAGGEAASQRLMDYLAELKAGDEVTVEYLRGDDRRTAKVKTEALGRNMLLSRIPGEFEFRAPRLPAMPELPRAELPAPFMVHLMRSIGDMELASLTPELGKYFGTETGLLVVRAPQAEEYKLRDGDVILKIDGREPKDAGHALRILSSYNGGETLKVEIMRDRKRQTLEIQVPDRKVGLRDLERGLERKLGIESPSAKIQ